MLIWRLKIAAKIALSRVPLAYRAWRRLGLFRHGAMHRADYALNVVRTHVDRLGGPERVRGATCLEIGPGDSLASAVIAAAYGAKRTWLVDAGAFADADIETYRGLARRLAGEGLPVPDLDGVADVPAMLERLGAVYLTDGVDSLAEIADGSVDLIWSQAVLEHIRLRDVPRLFAELRRIVAPSGGMSHQIDYRDHLGGSLNNLRFSQRVWESEFMAKSGFYTNRLRNSAMLAAMTDAGFTLTMAEPKKWPTLPLARGKLAPLYRDLSDDDLLTLQVDVVARPATAP